MRTKVGTLTLYYDDGDLVWNSDERLVIAVEIEKWLRLYSKKYLVEKLSEVMREVSEE